MEDGQGHLWAIEEGRQGPKAGLVVHVGGKDVEETGWFLGGDLGQYPQGTVGGE